MNAENLVEELDEIGWVSTVFIIVGMKLFGIAETRQSRGDYHDNHYYGVLVPLMRLFLASNSAAGLVPEPACQVEEEGEHEEGTRAASAQRAPADVFR